MNPAITVTLGPATADRAVILQLMQHADRFRLNASHLTVEELKTWLDLLGSLYSDAGKTLPLVVDLQGAKMRVGQYPTVARLPEEVQVVLGTHSNDPTILPVPCNELFRQVLPGELLTLNDRRVEMEVVEVDDKGFRAAVRKNGPVSSRKGINRPRHPVPYTAVRQADLEMIRVAGSCEFVQFAFSFAHDGQEAELLRACTVKPLIAKVERPEAMQHLSSIADNFDEIWFCRGDMGAQAGLTQLGKLQMDMVERIPELSCPVVIAGQLLQHMTVSSEPTRSEIVGLYRAVQDGFSGIVLSDETAVGKYPVEAVVAAVDCFKMQIQG